MLLNTGLHAATTIIRQFYLKQQTKCTYTDPFRAFYLFIIRFMHSAHVKSFTIVKNRKAIIKATGRFVVDSR